MPRGRLVRTVSVCALLVGAALGGGVLAGATLVRQPAIAIATDTSVDAGFARDMQAHHFQAVELALLVRDRSTDEDVRQLALDILLTQQQQAGQMAGWLETWGLPQTSGLPVMAWAEDANHTMNDPGDTTTGTPAMGTADRPVGYATMPGRVSSAEMGSLREVEGTQAERTFLELMIAHHIGGVEMAGIAAERAAGTQVRVLANAIVRGQNAELDVLRTMLDERGGPAT